jgi:alpha-L-arabinofuranosidase
MTRDESFTSQLSVTGTTAGHWQYAPIIRKRVRRRRPGTKVAMEQLESRVMLSVTVSAGTVLQAVDIGALGVNLTRWDNTLPTSQTAQMLEAAGLNFFRIGGGSEMDNNVHFNVTYAYQEPLPAMAQVVQSVGGTGMVTLDYGSGSPQEAAAEVAYLDGSTTDTTVIGNGEEYNTNTSTWAQVNWQTVGYWASLRAATPLGTDDGLNFLRIGQAASFGINYFEVGNEEYGSWETDYHGSGGDTGAAHDPATYATFCNTFYNLAKEIDSNLSVGIDSSGPGGDDNNWLGNVLTDGLNLGFIPGFISDHSYVQYVSGDESDSYLLNDTVSLTGQNSGDPTDWTDRAADYETDLAKVLGATNAAKVQLIATEFNSINGNPGKQTTSLVNGLFVAESIGNEIESGYSGMMFWDLRNGNWQTNNNNSSSLYGWRDGGDFGMIGSQWTSGSPPETGPYVGYPTYYAEELASMMVQAGGSVVQVASTDTNLYAYGVLEANGDLDLMVINADPNSAHSEQFNVTGFSANGQVEAWQYGETQDTAQENTTDGASSLANSTGSVTVTNRDFSYSFPQYSMTVLQVSPIAKPTIAQAAAAAPNPVTGTTANLSVLGSENGSDAGLTYTWSVTAAPSGAATPTFSANGTNAAKNATATFFAAGNYTFLATITDTNAQSSTSSVTVVVNQTIASALVSPASAAVGEDGTKQFSATAYDQFGAALATQPTFAWSVESGGGLISSTGLYDAPNATGTATIMAASGSISNTATVIINNLAASQLAIVEQPTGIFADDPFQVMVQVDDTFNDIVYTDHSNVTLSVDTGPTGGTLVGVVTVAAVNGMATFSDVALTQMGNYTLLASDGSLTTDTSWHISAIPMPPTRTLMSGIPISPQMMVFEERRLIGGLNPSTFLGYTSPNQETLVLHVTASPGAEPAFAVLGSVSDQLASPMDGINGTGGQSTDNLATADDILK